MEERRGEGIVYVGCLGICKRGLRGGEGLGSFFSSLRVGWLDGLSDRRWWTRQTVVLWAGDREVCDFMLPPGAGGWGGIGTWLCGSLAGKAPGYI